MAFKPGQSGNPGGLSKERRAYLAEIRKGEEANIKAVLAVLVKNALAEKEWAVVDYLDRMGIRIPESLELTGPDGEPLSGGIDLLGALRKLVGEGSP